MLEVALIVVGATTVALALLIGLERVFHWMLKKLDHH
jgi:hypothetical protein